MIKIDKDKVQIRYITGINKCLPDYPTPLDTLYESCMETADGNFFSDVKLKDRYGLGEEGIEKIKNILLDLGYIERNKERYKIIKTPWE